MNQTEADCFKYKEKFNASKHRTPKLQLTFFPPKPVDDYHKLKKILY